jgi:NAD(P)-dependent dehydrogenase (short-subunit alcohol dehydrogenase family)
MSTIQRKTILITGATNGLGEAAALELAKSGAEIIIVSRSAEKCAATAQKISQATGNARVRYYAADLSLMAETRRVADQIKRDTPTLDVLFNNAGAWFDKRQETAEGLEMHFALNHMSYFLLTNLLLDRLQAAAAKNGHARVISMSSSAHHQGAIYWDDLQHRKDYPAGSVGAGWGVYAESKLANVLFAFGLARRLTGTGVVSNAIHPGVVVTGFTQNNGWLYKIAAPFRRMGQGATPPRRCHAGDLAGAGTRSRHNQRALLWPAPQ